MFSYSLGSTGRLLFLLLLSEQLVIPTGGSLHTPSRAQIIDQKSFNFLKVTEPATEVNGTNVFIPPGSTLESLLDRPFHVYDDEFLEILGEKPQLTRIAHSAKDPLFHEAVVWYKESNEVFFVQNAGSPDAGTGLNKSSIIEKVDLAEVAAVNNLTDAVGRVKVQTVPSSPMVINPNGGANFRGQIVYGGEGQGSGTGPALWVMNPKEPYNTTILLNNYFGRQFNSLNDIAVHPINKDIYFIDVTYAYLQDFRPLPGLPNEVYRFNPDTGAVRVAADGFLLPNGLTFSPDGKYAYVTDTGSAKAFFGTDYTRPATIYRFNVAEDGTFENRKTFSYVSPGIPDGINCDSKGNVYAGCGDGVQVFNPSGKLIGKFFLGTTSAGFNFVGDGGIVITAETDLYYATVAAKGAYVESEM